MVVDWSDIHPQATFSCRLCFVAVVGMSAAKLEDNIRMLQNLQEGEENFSKYQT